MYENWNAFAVLRLSPEADSDLWLVGTGQPGGELPGRVGEGDDGGRAAPVDPVELI